MADTPKHSVSVAGIVIDEQDRVLVIQRRDNGHWEPPGGVLELAESPEDGVIREVLEETGIAVKVRGLSGVYKNLDRGVIALVFRCDPVDGVERPSDESRQVAWRSLTDAEHLMDEAYFVRVADAFVGEPRVRTHDGTQLVQR